MSYHNNWGEDKVWFHEREGRLHSLPAGWTDVVAVDPFVIVAAGRSLFRPADLLELAALIVSAKQKRDDGCKENDVQACK